MLSPGSLQYQKVRSKPFDEDLEHGGPDTPLPQPHKNYIGNGLKLALLTSLAINIILLQNTSFWPTSNRKHVASLDRAYHDRFMGYFRPDSPYTSDNETERDEAWNSVNIGQGLVAIDSKVASSNGLPETRRWKPDRSKSVYLVAAYHALHCIPYIRHTVMGFGSSTGLSSGQKAHLDHCLDVIRAEVMCTADDTLLTSPVSPSIDGHLPAPGINQTRQCRNFEAIRDWTFENTACYLDVELNPNATNYWDNCRTDGWIISREM